MTEKKNIKFKLILGLGNKDVKGALNMALLYARAGVRFFDGAPEILPKLKSAILKAGFDINDFILCASVPSLGDIHGRKAKISEVVCASCGLCKPNCPEGAILKNKKTGKYETDLKKCIGCGACKKNTNCYAISFEYGNAEVAFLKNELIDKGFVPDMVELHASVPDKKRITEDFKELISIFKGDISVCIKRNLFPIEVAAELLGGLEKLYYANCDGTFYVQADGASMNGGAEAEESTQECILFAEELQTFASKLGMKYCSHLIVAGGTNMNTPYALNTVFKDLPDCPIIGYGTYARKLVAGLSNSEALTRAKELLNETEKYDRSDSLIS